MNIDEKLKNNWYLEQDEINTLIKRYRMMKYFNYVLLLIISALLLTGCGIFSSDTEEEIDYPFRSGTWVIDSPSDANWVGTNDNPYSTNKSTASTDTIYIEQPGDFDMEMWHYEDHIFTLRLNHDMPQDSINPSKTTVKLPGAFPDSDCQYGCHTAMRPHPQNVEFDFDYHCDDIQNNVIIFTFRREDGTPFQVAQFNTNGFKDAVETVAQCN